MRIAIRRSRIVTVRLPEDQYAEFLTLCASEGVRTISDLARLALMRMREQMAGAAPDDESNLNCKETVEGLVRDVRRLEALLNSASLPYASPFEKSERQTGDPETMQLAERASESGSVPAGPGRNS